MKCKGVNWKLRSQLLFPSKYELVLFKSNLISIEFYFYFLAQVLFWDCLGGKKNTLNSVNRQQELLATAQALCVSGNFPPEHFSLPLAVYHQGALGLLSGSVFSCGTVA